MRWLLGLFGVALGLLSVLAAAALTAPHWLAEDSVRHVISRHLGDAIGGRAELRGPLQWRLLPTPQATLADLSLSAAPDWSADASTATLSGSWADLWREARKFRRDGPVGPPVP
jgi:uncharacterized protein involved in outer membrane biogenesis